MASGNTVVGKVLFFGKIFGLHPVKLGENGATFDRFSSICTATLLIFYYVICCFRFRSSFEEKQSVSTLVNYLQVLCFIASLTANIFCPIANRKKFAIALNLLQSFKYSSNFLPVSCIVFTFLLVTLFVSVTVAVTINSLTIAYILTAVVSISVNSVNVCQLFIFSWLFYEYFKHANNFLASSCDNSQKHGKRDNTNKQVLGNLKIFSQLNCELRTSVGYFSSTYSVPLLVNVATIFLVIIVQSYYGFLVTGLPFIKQCLVAVWITIHVLQLLAVVAGFELITKEASRVGETLNVLLLKSSDPEIRTELSYISLQVSNQPLNFSACNFFNLNFQLLLSLGGALTTYLMILSQFAGKATKNDGLSSDTFMG